MPSALMVWMASWKRTVWRRLRYQYSASIVVVSMRCAVIVEYSAISAGRGVIGPSPSSSCVADTFDLGGVRGVVDGDLLGPHTVGLTARDELIKAGLRTGHDDGRGAVDRGQ